MNLRFFLLLTFGWIPFFLFADEKKEIYLPANPTAAKYYISRLTNEELLGAPRVEPVLKVLLERKGLDSKSREEALRDLAALHKTDRLTELLAAFQQMDAQGTEALPALNELGRLLLDTKPSDLSTLRARLQDLLAKSQQPRARQILYAALVTADGKLDGIWGEAAKDNAHLADLIAAAPQISPASLREQFFPKLSPMLKQDADPSLRLAAIQVLPAFKGHEAETFLTLAPLISKEPDRAATVHALQQIPRSFWPKDQAAPLCQTLIVYAKKVPEDLRTETDFLEATQLANDLSTLLPPNEGKVVRKTIREIGVNVLFLKTVREQMRYDRTRLVVESGKPVEIILQNDDAMEHNFVLTTPGAREEVGKAAEALPDPDDQGRKFVPHSPKVLQATKLVPAGERLILQFTAPAEPGEYPYLCTFPGHWSIMFGTLLVVQDLDTAALPPENPVTEWKLADFDEAWETFETNRNFAVGKEQFTKLACVQCHQLGKEGNVFGPPLAGIVKKWKERKLVLQQILEPSLNVEEKYRPLEIKTAEDTIRGFLVAEDPQTISVQTGPNATFMQKIARSEIQSRTTTATSLMPSALLNSLTKEQILDLLAYLEAEGNPDAPFFHRH